MYLFPINFKKNKLLEKISIDKLIYVKRIKQKIIFLMSKFKISSFDNIIHINVCVYLLSIFI